MVQKKPKGDEDFRQAAMQALDDFKEVEEGRREEVAAREAKKGEKNKIWQACQWLALILSMGIILYQMPDMISTVTHEEKPLNKGVVKTDPLTDRCLQDLWRISKELQEGILPDGSRTCPASQKPYAVVKTEDDIVVRVPQPELYGFSEIRVSRKNPVPEIIK